MKLIRITNDRTWSNRRIACLLFVFALIIRVVYVLIAPRVDPFLKAGNGLWGDAYYYHMVAVNLAEGKGFVMDPGVGKPIEFVNPLLPHFLALVYLIFGPNIKAAMLAQALLGAVMVPVIFFTGVRIFNSRAVGILAGLGAVLYPLLLVFTAWLYAETIYLLLIALAILLFSYLQESQSARHALLLGFVLGLSMLARPMLTAFAPFLLMWALLAIKNKWRAAGIAALVLVVMFLTTFTWSFRNYLANGKWVMVRSYPAYALWIQNNPLANGGVGTSPEFDQAVFDLLAEQYPGFESLSEEQQNQKALEATVHWVVTDPLGYAQLLGKKVVRFWSPLALTISDTSRENPIPQWVVAAVSIPYAGFILLAVIGLIAAVKRRLPVLILFLFILYFQLITLLFSASTRYAMPVVPSMLLLASFGLVVSVRRIFPSQRKA